MSLASRIFPDWSQMASLHTPLTEGESNFLHFLDENLPKDPSWREGQNLEDYKGWLIFAQPFLNGARPDVVVFHPFVGIIIYEVKEWNLSNYSWKKREDGTVLTVNDGKGEYIVKSPVRQVDYYKKLLIEQLVPAIGEEVDANVKQYGLVKTGLYFHRALEADALQMFASAVKNTAFFPILGKNSLSVTNLQAVVPGVQYSTSRYWNREWNKEILFWLIPPFHSIEQGTELKLKAGQTKLAEPRPGHHRARGVAGSGKTQALAYRAGKLASMKQNVLIVTFNITLWHYIRDMIRRSPFAFSWDKITFHHFHGFCKTKLNEFGRLWPNSPGETEEALAEFFRVIVPEAVKEASEGKTFDVYDAILIDEGQDYHVEWYDLLHTKFLSNRDELLVVCDKKQNIYERELDWLDKRSTRGLDKFTERYIDLTTTFRMPKRVAQLSLDFSETFELNQDLKVAEIDGAPVHVHSPHIVWQNIEDDSWLQNVDYAFQRLKRERYSVSDMVVLLPTHKKGRDCVDYFKQQSIAVNHVFEDDDEKKYHPHKKAFWMGDGRLKMSTIHSFKGWELLNIVLYIPKHAPESNRRLDAMVYTAITRTRENLIVLNANSRYAKFGERYPKHWHQQ